MSERKTAPRDAKNEPLVRAAVDKTRGLPGLAHALAVAAGRVAEAVGEVETDAPDLAQVRTALDELATARRAFDLTMNDVVEITDRLLDAFNHRTRHLLR